MTYYVKIDNPKGFRRDVLVTSKQVINSLQASRNVLAVREKKKELLKSLQDQVKEIVLLTSKLDEILPDKELREEALRREKEEEEKKARARKDKNKGKSPSKKASKDDKPAKGGKKKSSSKKASSPKSAPKSTPEALDDALAKIEQKLASLN